MKVWLNLLAIYYSCSYLEICPIAPGEIIVISSRELFPLPMNILLSYYKDEALLAKRGLNLVVPEIMSYYLRDLEHKSH